MTRYPSEGPTGASDEACADAWDRLARLLQPQADENILDHVLAGLRAAKRASLARQRVVVLREWREVMERA